jgi:hypothetical protein
LLALRVFGERNDESATFRARVVFLEVVHDYAFLWGEIDVILGILFDLPEHAKYVIT